MGGRGKKRREKNYLKSHGGDKRLPPPPTSSTDDPLPYKLRKLMSFTTSRGDEWSSENGIQLKSKKGNAPKSKPQSVVQDKPKSTNSNTKTPTDKTPSMPESKQNLKTDGNEDKNKKKRKRKEVNDMRFEAEMTKLGVISVRKQRKKEFLKNRKKKQKKGASDQTLDLPKRDEVKFGDVVQAPPKLPVLPKASKKTLNPSHEHLSLIPKAPKKPMSASNERLRLQAIEAYRNRRGTKRLGISLPSLSESSDL